MSVQRFDVGHFLEVVMTQASILTCREQLQRSLAEAEGHYGAFVSTEGRRDGCSTHPITATPLLVPRRVIFTPTEPSCAVSLLMINPFINNAAAAIREEVQEDRRRRNYRTGQIIYA